MAAPSVRCARCVIGGSCTGRGPRGGCTRVARVACYRFNEAPVHCAVCTGWCVPARTTNRPAGDGEMRMTLVAYARPTGRAGARARACSGRTRPSCSALDRAPSSSTVPARARSASSASFFSTFYWTHRFSTPIAVGGQSNQ